MGYIELHGRKWYGVTVGHTVADILSKRLSAAQTEYVSVPQPDGRLFIGTSTPAEVATAYLSLTGEPAEYEILYEGLYCLDRDDANALADTDPGAFLQFRLEEPRQQYRRTLEKVI